MIGVPDERMLPVVEIVKRTHRGENLTPVGLS